MIVLNESKNKIFIKIKTIEYKENCYIGFKYILGTPEGVKEYCYNHAISKLFRFCSPLSKFIFSLWVTDINYIFRCLYEQGEIDLLINFISDHRYNQEHMFTTFSLDVFCTDNCRISRPFNLLTQFSEKDLINDITDFPRTHGLIFSHLLSCMLNRTVIPWIPLNDPAEDNIEERVDE